MKAKDPNQIKISFNDQKTKPSFNSLNNRPKEAKQIHFNPRKEIYEKILNRKME